MDGIKGIRTFRGCIAVPRSKGAVGWYNDVPDRRVDRLGAFLFGICDQSQGENEEYIDVLWPVYKEDKVLWKRFHVPSESISLVPAEKGKEAIEKWHKSVSVGSKDLVYVIRKGKGLINLRPNAYARDLGEFVFCMADVSEKESNSLRHLLKRKGYWDQIIKIRIPENVSIFWPSIYVSSAYTYNDRSYPESWDPVHGFRWNGGEEPLDPEDLLLLSVDQAKRLAGEYYDQIVGFIDTVIEAQKKLPISYR